MHIRFLLLIFCLVSGVVHAQDSSFYFPLYKPSRHYREAGVKQEIVFRYRYKSDQILDSTLIRTVLYDSAGRVVRYQQFQMNKLRTSETFYYSGPRLDSMIREEVWLKARLRFIYYYKEGIHPFACSVFNGLQPTMRYRYQYNARGQLLEILVRIVDGQEFVQSRYHYRPDHLIEKVDHDDEYGRSNLEYSIVHFYTPDRQMISSYYVPVRGKRLLDCIRQYNGTQLSEIIHAPFPKKGWKPFLHPRTKEVVETFSYLPNRLPDEVKVTINDHLIQKEKHFYIYDRPPSGTIDTSGIQ